MAGFLGRLGCLVGRHATLRRSAHYEGTTKIGVCRYCGAELEKRRDGRWVARRGARGEAHGEGQKAAPDED